MIGILRAFAWLRWRMFINSLERTGSRDMLERFSIAAEKLKPIMAAVLMIPSGLALATLGAAAGYALASGESASLLVRVPRYVLAAFPALSVVGPLFLPAADRVNPVRILLLPIERRTLYAAQTAAALGDIWIAPLLPLVAAVPFGLAAGGAPGAALVSAAGGVLLTALVLAVSSTTTSVIHMAVRDRRRGEILTLIVMLAIPIASMLPGLLLGAAPSGNQHGDTGALERLMAAAPWVRPTLLRVASWYPTELYATAIAAAVAGHVARMAAAVAGLAAEAAVVTLGGWLVFRRVMDSPFSSRARKGVRARAIWERRLPGLSPGASAVALAHCRLAVRSPRGRAMVVAPVALVFVYALLMRQDFSYLTLAGWALDPGLVMASFGAFVCLLSTLPITMNQFGIDTGGLTRVLLSPLSDGDYLAGKAVGNALIAAVPAALTVGASWAAAPGSRDTAPWTLLAPALLAIYLLVAPVAAMLSALFPKKVDLNSIGRQSNAHGVAGTLGILALLAAGAATFAAAAGASYVFTDPVLRLAAVSVWCGVSAAVCAALFVPAKRLFAARRENLAML